MFAGCMTNSNDEIPLDELALYTDEDYPIQVPVGFELDLFAENLEAPTSVEFPPDGSNRLFVNELNTGKILIFENGEQLSQPFLNLAEITPDQYPLPGARGLIGLEFDPNYSTNGFVYIAYGTSVDGQEKGVIARVRDQNNQATDFTILQGDLPSYQGHQVQNLEFGPDNMLYASVGDAYEADLAQDTTALNGKILRFTADGSVPTDNPFGPENPVYAMGFRNPYDLIFSNNGELFVNDNGSQANDAFYEVSTGSNAGWPVVEGEHNNPDFIQPLYVWENTVVPTGMHIYRGSQFPDQYRGKLFMMLYGVTTEGLNPNGKRLQIVDLEEVNLTKSNFIDFMVYRFEGSANPIDVTEGPDGTLYISDFVQGHIYSISYSGN
jgi:quinoprotein glucose dehydrogenase